jgi:hypothetical protein
MYKYASLSAVVHLNYANLSVYSDVWVICMYASLSGIIQCNCVNLSAYNNLCLNVYVCMNKYIYCSSLHRHVINSFAVEYTYMYMFVFGYVNVYVSNFDMISSVHSNNVVSIYNFIIDMWLFSCYRLVQYGRERHGPTVIIVQGGQNSDNNNNNNNNNNSGSNIISMISSSSG